MTINSNPGYDPYPDWNAARACDDSLEAGECACLLGVYVCGFCRQEEAEEQLIEEGHE